MKNQIQTSTVPPLSQSKQSLMACGYLYRERVVLCNKEPENVFALRGTQIHQAVADYCLHLAKIKSTQDPVWLKCISETRGYSDEAIEILHLMADRLVFDPEHVLDVELHLALDEKLEPTDEGDVNAYEGTLDLVLCPSPSVAIIDDWKSYWQVIDADTFQAKLYPLLLFKHFPGIEEIHFRLQFVRYGVAKEVTYLREDVPALEKLAQAERQRQIALHAETQAISPMPGSHCGYCSLLSSTCPIREMNPYAEMSVGDRARFGLWLTQAKKQNDQILKGLVNIQGPVQIADANGQAYIAEFRLVEKSKFPASALSVVIANEPALVEKLTLSGLSSPLKAKKRAQLKELLESCKVTQAGSRFCIAKRGEVPESEWEE